MYADFTGLIYRHPVELIGLISHDTVNKYGQGEAEGFKMLAY